MLKNYFSFAKSNPHFLLFGLITAFFGNYGQSFFIAWFGKYFQQDFNLTNAEYGSLYSAATLLSGFIILYFGALLDKTSLKKFSIFTCLGLSIACIALSFSFAIWHLFLALFLLRFCGQGLMFHIAYTSMARYFEKNRGKAIGIVSFGMPLGEAILPLAAVFFISHFGWQNTWLILGISLPLIFLPLIHYLINRSQYLFDRYASKDHSEKSNPSIQLKSSQPESLQSEPSQLKSGQLDGWSRKQVVKDLRFWRLIPAIMSPAFIVTGIFIHQAELLQSKNWSEEWFAICFIFYAASHLLGSLVIGSLVDQYSGTKLIRYYLLPMLFAIATLALPIDYKLMGILFMLSIGLTIGASGPIVGSLWVELYGSKHLGAIRSMVTSIMVISTAISPVLLGYLFDIGYDYQAVMIFLMTYLFLAMLLGFKIKT